MIESKYIELMNLELDGTATDAQRQELRRHLAANPAAASHFEELSRVVRGLDAHPQVEPPAQLHPRIMAAVDGAVRAPSTAHGLAGWLQNILAAPRQRVLAPFAVGVATGAFLLAAVHFGRSGGWDPSRDIDPAALSGTMAPVAAHPEAAIELDAAADGLGGSIELYTEHGVTVIEAHLDAPDPVDWTLAFGGDLAVSRIEAPGGAAVFGASEGEVHGRQAGAGNYRITLSGRAEPVESVVLKVVRGGEAVVERTASPVH
jgi:anti-sigma factor RsiW